MNNIKLTAVIPGLIASAAIALSFSLPFNAEIALGFATVLMLGGVAVLEYRLNWKRLFSR